jgi:hypothetical protein
MIDQSDDDASKALTKLIIRFLIENFNRFNLLFCLRMIYDSLNNVFQNKLNFVFHTIAQPCASNTNSMFSFVTESYKYVCLAEVYLFL